MQSRIGRVIKRLRVAKKLSQADLARRLDVTRGAVWNWENDLKLPASRMMPRLARALKTTIGALHGERAA